MTHSHSSAHSHAHDHDHHEDDDHGHAHDGHGTSHSHGPGGHVHAPASYGTAFAVGIALNTAFVIVEAIYGYASNSTALIADAGHNLSDVLGLVVAWIAVILAKRPASPRYTYGLRGSSILAALFNAVFLLIAVGAIGWEAIWRLVNPEPVAEVTVMIVAAIGIVINGFTAWLFASGSKTDLNIRGAYLHMAADAAVSAGVVVAALIIMFTGWLWLDPLVSLVIVAVIVWGTWGLLRDSTAATMRRHAGENDANRLMVLVITSLLTLIVLAAISGELERVHHGSMVAAAKLVVTLLLIWLFANSVYALHYAHAFYLRDAGTGGDRGGIDFPGTKTPSYSDFCYFAFTLGMTFQTSDVDITAPRMRQIALLHSFAAFVFNIGVIAFTINVLGGG